MKTKNEQLEKIAQEELSVVTLEARNMDRLDFYDVSVWSIKKALERAYELGKKAKNKVCPKCGKEYEANREALSRKDNTPICSDCGTAEALAEMGL